MLNKDTTMSTEATLPDDQAPFVDEPLSSDNILEEAEALMNSTMPDTEFEKTGVSSQPSNSNSMVIGGFSIDDNEDNDYKDVSQKEDSVNDLDLMGDERDPLTGGIDEETVARSLSLGNSSRTLLTLHPLQDEMVRGTPPAHPSLADVKAKASDFASSVANFAIKTANNVANAAAGTQSMQPAAIQQRDGSANTPASAPLLLVELDNEQKTRLLDQHLGPFLPGERVIMFLTNLLHVSDSSGYDYPTPPGSMWCCCMTYYRVVLFCTATAVMETPSWLPLTPPPNLLQMPLGSMAGVEKSIYTTPQNTSLMCLVMHG